MANRANTTPRLGLAQSSASTSTVGTNPTDERDRLHFAHLPTPLEALDRLSHKLGGPHLFIKRDDCTGLAAGGGMARKLEFLMADAIARSSNVVVMQCPVRSNHALQTAAISGKLNMECVLVPESTESASEGVPNVGSGIALLDELYGAKFRHFANGPSTEAAAQALADECEILDQSPYIIPRSGSNRVGALGYVNCAFEITDQLRQQGLRIDRLVLCSDNGGTQAGLIVGFQLTTMRIPVLGISLSMPKVEQQEAVYNLCRQTSEHLGLEQMPPRDDVVVNADYIRNSGDIPSPKTLNAVTTVARCESILLDPSDSGVAMGGLIDLITNKHEFGRDENILFLHSGGYAGLYEHTAHLAKFLRERADND